MVDDRDARIAQLEAELRQAREQQAATADILRVIHGSTADLQAVLHAVATNAARLCEASDAQIFQVEGELYRKVAGLRLLPVTLPVGEALPIRGSRAGARAIRER